MALPFIVLPGKSLGLQTYPNNLRQSLTGNLARARETFVRAGHWPAIEGKQLAKFAHITCQDALNESWGQIAAIIMWRTVTMGVIFRSLYVYPMVLHASMIERSGKTFLTELKVTCSNFL
jgi:hypothetical protein